MRLQLILYMSITFILSGCSTIVGQSRQTINVTSSSLDTNCTVTMDDKAIDSIVLPAKLSLITGGYPEYKVICILDGIKQEESVKKRINPWILGNILWPWFISIDAITGTVVQYQDLEVKQISSK